MTLDELRATRRSIDVATALGTLAFENPLQIIPGPIAAYHYDLPMGPSVIIRTGRGFEYAWVGGASHRDRLEDAEEALWREFVSFQ